MARNDPRYKIVGTSQSGKVLFDVEEADSGMGTALCYCCSVEDELNETPGATVTIVVTPLDYEFEKREGEGLHDEHVRFHAEKGEDADHEHSDDPTEPTPAVQDPTDEGHPPLGGSPQST